MTTQTKPLMTMADVLARHTARVNAKVEAAPRVSTTPTFDALPKNRADKYCRSTHVPAILNTKG